MAGRWPISVVSRCRARADQIPLDSCHSPIFGGMALYEFLSTPIYKRPPFLAVISGRSSHGRVCGPLSMEGEVRTEMRNVRKVVGRVHSRRSVYNVST